MCHLFFDGEGLAGQHCLADKKVFGHQQNAICRDQTAGGEQHNITGHHRSGGDRLGLAIAQHRCLDRHARLQLCYRRAGPIFLPETKQGTAENDQQDNGGVDPLLGKGRDDHGKDQDQDQGTFELIEQQSQRRDLPPRLERIGPNLL